MQDGDATERKDGSPGSAAPPDFLGARKLEKGIGLCLSGGGFRAMLFHVGAIARLNEFGMLPRLSRVSSVSGGSLAAGALAIAWKELEFDSRGVASNLGPTFAQPVLSLAQRRLDVRAIAFGRLPGASASAIAARAYDRHLIGGRTLQDLPEAPRFTFTATSLQTGALWRFSREYAADYRVGEWRAPTLRLADVIAASAAFPPFMSPAIIRVPPGSIAPMDGADLFGPPYAGRLVLTDGGVYDNLGLEPVWKRYKTILVSDGGLATPPIPGPGTSLLSLANRATSIALQQGINMRRRVLFGLNASGARHVAYWGIGQGVASYGTRNPLGFEETDTRRVAVVPTRLTRFSPDIQALVLRAGYAHADAALTAAGFPPPAEPPSFGSAALRGD